MGAYAHALLANFDLQRMTIDDIDIAPGSDGTSFRKEVTIDADMNTKNHELYFFLGDTSQEVMEPDSTIDSFTTNNTLIVDPFKIYTSNGAGVTNKYMVYELSFDTDELLIP